MTTKRALVLSGGGSRGSYEVGALLALAESGRSWSSVHGVSVGALNGAWVAMNKPEDHPGCISGLHNIWKGIKHTSSIYQPWVGWLKLHYIWSMWKGSLNSGNPLRKLMAKTWDIEKLKASNVKLTVGCVSLTTGRYHTFSQDNPKIMEYILASSHLPVVFEPLEIDGEQWADGGMRHQIPILEALREDPDEIDVILTSAISMERVFKIEKKVTSATMVALRTFDILADQVFTNDYFMTQRAAKHNDKDIKINIFAPGAQPNMDSMDFSEANIKLGIDLGYVETKEKLIAGI